MQEHCPPEKTIRYSLLTICCPPLTIRCHFTSRHSLPFPDLPICRFHDLPISSARQETRPPNSFRPPSRVPRPVPFLSLVPCPFHNFTCQTLIVSSLLAEARKLPDGEKANAKAQLRPPSRVKTNCQSLVRQTRNRSSMLHETANCPSGRKATALTSR